MADTGSAATTISLIAIGCVAFFAVLFWIVFAGARKESDVDTAHLHDDILDIEDAVLKGVHAAAPAAAPAVTAAPETDAATLDELVRRILAATTPDERSSAFADIVSRALSMDELSAVVAGMTPPAGGAPIGNTVDDLERLKQLAVILKSGDVKGGLAMTGGDSSALTSLYEAVIASLSESPVISDKTRTLLSYIQVQKCQRDFAGDAVKMTACLTAIPVAGKTGGTTPAPAGGSTASSPLETATVVSDMTVLPDGLTVKTAAGSTAKFTFDRDRLTVCADGEAACKSTPLV